MPKQAATFDVAPELPTPKRRIPRDWTESIVDVFAFAATTLLVLVSTRVWIFDIPTQSEYDFMKNLSIGLAVVFWIAAIRLDLSAKKNAEKLFETQMNDYEVMRSKWLELASQKLEIDAKKK